MKPKKRTLRQLVADLRKTKPKDEAGKRAKLAFFAPYVYGLPKRLS
jgi:hypothetical protein